MPIPPRFNVLFSWSTSALMHVAVGGAIAGFGGSSVIWFSDSSSPQGNAFSSPVRLAGAMIPSDQPEVHVKVVRAIAVPLPPAPELIDEIAPQSTAIERQITEAETPIPSLDVGKFVEHFVSAEVTDIVIRRKTSESDKPQIDHDEEPAAAPKHGSRELAEPALGDHGSGPDNIDKRPSIAGADKPPSPFPSNPTPIYPDSARSEGRQGRAVVLMRVSAEGKVTHAEIFKSSGWPDVDAAALATAKTWEFTPARREGKPVAYEFIKPFTFRIEN